MKKLSARILKGIITTLWKHDRFFILETPGVCVIPLIAILRQENNVFFLSGFLLKNSEAVSCLSVSRNMIATGVF